jgi:hypothetical protein
VTGALLEDVAARPEAEKSSASTRWITGSVDTAITGTSFGSGVSEPLLSIVAARHGVGAKHNTSAAAQTSRLIAVRHGQNIDRHL